MDIAAIDLKLILKIGSGIFWLFENKEKNI
jgi:hypothetical protein